MKMMYYSVMTQVNSKKEIPSASIRSRTVISCSFRGESTRWILTMVKVAGCSALICFSRTNKTSEYVLNWSYFNSLAVLRSRSLFWTFEPLKPHFDGILKFFRSSQKLKKEMFMVSGLQQDYRSSSSDRWDNFWVRLSCLPSVKYRIVSWLKS